MKLIDLTQTFTDNMPVYPGDPPVSLKQITTIEKDTYTDHQIQSVMHVGTHMDAPLHMIPGGKNHGPNANRTILRSRSYH